MPFRIFTALCLAVSLAPAADPALLNLVMPEARVVGGVDLDQIKSSPFGMFAISQMEQQNSDIQKLIDTTGFDPRRDLQEVLIAAPDSPRHGQHGLFLVRGVFDVPRISAALKAQGGAVTQYQGVEILTHGKAVRAVGAKTNEFALAFLDATTAVGGDPGLVRDAIGRRQTGSQLDPRLLAKIREVSGVYDAWGVSIVPFGEFASQVPDPNVSGALKGDVLKAIEQTAGGVKFGPSVLIAAEVVAKTEKDAADLAAVARFVVGLVQMQMRDPKAAELAGLLNSLEVKTEATSVKVSLSVPEEMIEKAMQSGRKRAVVKNEPPREVEFVVQQGGQGAAPAVRRSADPNVVVLPGPND